MTHRTLLLDPETWDLVLDAAGNIASVSAPYAIAQTAANALRTFLGEPWYNTAQGVPYWQAILGRPASLPAATAALQAAALTVQGVTAAAVVLDAVAERTLSGVVYVTDRTGQTSAAAFSAGA